MPGCFAALSRLGVMLMISVLLLGCGVAACVPSPTRTPTIAPPNISPTSCLGAYTWANGSVPPAFITQVQDAMRTSGLEGSVQASTFGENDGCGTYHAQAVDYAFTVHVQNLEASEDLASKASTILEIARRFVRADLQASPAPNLGNLQLTFQAENEAKCEWFYREGAWNSGGPGQGDISVCPAPVSQVSRRLAEALHSLATDLACETSAVTANTLQAVLECERPEAEDRYIVTVRLRLNEQGNGYEESCLHGYKAHAFSSTGDAPMTVTEGTKSYFERDRIFQWAADGILYDLFERIKGGPEVTFPPDTAEKVYQRALQEGLISGEGSDCPK